MLCIHMYAKMPCDLKSNSKDIDRERTLLGGKQSFAKGTEKEYYISIVNLSRDSVFKNIQQQRQRMLLLRLLLQLFECCWRESLSALSRKSYLYRHSGGNTALTSLMYYHHWPTVRPSFPPCGPLNS